MLQYWEVNFMIFAYIFLGLLVLALVLGIVNLFIPKGNHNPNHPGITQNGKDIICPKCQSPYCEYVFEQNTKEVTTYRYRPLHPLKPVKATTRTKPTLIQPMQKYRCKNCGWIFQ